MSLLPGQILPEAVPIGEVREDGKVTISHNWWLLFYNLCMLTLPNNGDSSASVNASFVVLDDRINEIQAQIKTDQSLRRSLMLMGG